MPRDEDYDDEDEDEEYEDDEEDDSTTLQDIKDVADTVKSIADAATSVKKFTKTSTPRPSNPPPSPNLGTGRELDKAIRDAKKQSVNRAFLRGSTKTSDQASSEPKTNLTKTRTFREKHPHIIRNSIYVIGLIAAVSTLTGFTVFDLGDIINSTNPSEQIIPVPNSEEASEDQNEFARWIRQPKTEDGKHILVLEFGVKHMEQGAEIEIIFNSTYSNVKKSFAKPYQNEFPTGGGTFIQMGIFEEEPPSFYNRFSEPAITPNKSYYLYFESDDPLGIEDVLYKKFEP